MAWKKSIGITPTERYLAHLCDRTFLSLWSYPNVFRDQGRLGAGIGKELCDLLVVFDKEIVVFSDKSCEFPDTGDLRVDWSRWYKRAIEKSAKQLYGARRWISEHPDRVFLDEKCETPFPFQFPDPGTRRFHLVAVALGAKTRCQRTISGSGSLVLCPEITGSEHTGETCRPFFVGDVDPTREYVHVFDDVTLNVILSELDTVADFVDYLRRKESFIRAGKLAVAEGEENLLAHYVRTMGNEGHDFDLPDGYDRLWVKDGAWKRHFESPQRQQRLQADRPSYLWDDIIEECTRHMLGGTALVGSVENVDEFEEGVRIMAAERRTSRRGLAEAIIDRVRTTPVGMIAARTVLPDDTQNLAYVIVAMPDGKDDASDRRYRRNYLLAYCQVLALKYRERTVVLGIGTESQGASGRSYDLALVRSDEWNADDIAQVARLQEELDVLRDGNILNWQSHTDEYPADRIPVAQSQDSRGDDTSHPNTRRRRVGRNDPCPCGSGRKFKRCCLRK